MTTVLFSALYLDGLSPCGGSRLERTIKYERHYWPLRDRLGFDQIIYVDNASSEEALAKLRDANPEVNRRVIRYPDHLAKGSSGFDKQHRMDLAAFDYPYCWRALWEIRNLSAEGIGKFLMIDTDMFVLSDRLLDHLRGLNDGWTAFWCPKYSFPETSLQVLAGEGLHQFLAYTTGHWRDKVGQKMETALPFTHIEKSFIGDRFGEEQDTLDRAMENSIDYLGQLAVTCQVPVEPTG